MILKSSVLQAFRMPHLSSPYTWSYRNLLIVPHAAALKIRHFCKPSWCLSCSRSIWNYLIKLCSSCHRSRPYHLVTSFVQAPPLALTLCTLSLPTNGYGLDAAFGTVFVLSELQSLTPVCIFSFLSRALCDIFSFRCLVKPARMMYFLESWFESLW